jgi:hypothetical protein
MQLVSVRSNQDFGLDYKTGKLIPSTEIIVLIEKPAYKVKGEKITRDTQVSELRFKCGSVGLAHLIGQLEQAQKNILHFEKMAGSLNEIIVNAKPIEGSTEVL